MAAILQRVSDQIEGCISGFDRSVFKGCIRPLMCAVGAQKFFRSRGVLDKNSKPWVLEQSAALNPIMDGF